MGRGLRQPSAAQIQVLLSHLQEGGNHCKADTSNPTATTTTTTTTTTTITTGTNYNYCYGENWWDTVRQNESTRIRNPRRKRGNSWSALAQASQSWDWRLSREIGELGVKGIGFGERIGERVPGLRYSASFLSTLGANLALSSSLCPPDIDTPATPSPMASTLPPVYRADTSDSTLMPTQPTESNPLASIPDFSMYVTTSTHEKISALKLVADSVAQQRQLAALAIIYSPLFIALAALALGVLVQRFYTEPGDLPLIGTTYAGILMAGLVGVRWCVSGYIDLAERITWDWLGSDEVMVSRFGDSIVGAVIFGVVKESKRRRGRGMLRAWTVRNRERHRGVGKGLLEEVARILMKERGCETVEFDAFHANSHRILHDMFNRQFDRDERRAIRLLEVVRNEHGGRRRSR